MIRVVLRTDDATMAAHVSGANIHVQYRTMDFDLPELEKALREGGSKDGLMHIQVAGVEVINDG